ncbi:MAG: hypothetical protein JNK23_10405 [Opitutaceae bacterium]|nr:hypothetical protein [Opitutaceae bacterium]
MESPATSGMDEPRGIDYGGDVKQPPYLKLFPEKSAARDWARIKNRANRLPRWLWVVADGPNDDFAVLDIRTAIEGEHLYEWEA